jgi:hypothetical protein
MHRWFLAIFWLFLATLQTAAQASNPLQITAFMAPPLFCNGPVIDPTSPIDAGSIVLGQKNVAEICLSNTGSTPITLTNVVVTGADFALTVPFPGPMTLQPNKGNTQFISISFTPSAAGNSTGQISFADDAAGSPQNFVLTGTAYTDFGINFLYPLSITVNAGQTANFYHLFIESLSSPPAPQPFVGTITVTCNGMPQGANCMLSPTNVFVANNGVGAPDLFITVTTTAPTSARLNVPQRNLWWPFASVLLIALGALRKRRLPHLIVPALMIILVSCGASKTNGNPGPTPAGTFHFTVTATSNNISHSRTLTLIVK